MKALIDGKIGFKWEGVSSAVCLKLSFMAFITRLTLGEAHFYPLHAIRVHDVKGPWESVNYGKYGGIEMPP